MLRISSYLKQTNVKTEKNIMQEGGKGFKEKITLWCVPHQLHSQLKRILLSTVNVLLPAST